jgi:hypothetical protein
MTANGAAGETVPAVIIPGVGLHAPQRNHTAIDWLTD